MAVPTPTRQSQTPEQTRRARLDKQLRAEREMVHSIIRGIVITTPIAVAALILMMALAIGNQQPWYVWTGLGALMGVYAAGFFGTIVGVMRSSHLLDELDEEAMHLSERSATRATLFGDSGVL